jgi:hypothetical protein
VVVPRPGGGCPCFGCRVSSAATVHASALLWLLWMCLAEAHMIPWIMMKDSAAIPRRRDGRRRRGQKVVVMGILGRMVMKIDVRLMDMAIHSNVALTLENYDYVMCYFKKFIKSQDTRLYFLL